MKKILLKNKQRVTSNHNSVTGYHPLMYLDIFELLRNSSLCKGLNDEQVNRLVDSKLINRLSIYWPSPAECIRLAGLHRFLLDITVSSFAGRRINELAAEAGRYPVRFAGYATLPVGLIFSSCVLILLFLVVLYLPCTGLKSGDWYLFTVL